MKNTENVLRKENALVVYMCHSCNNILSELYKDVIRLVVHARQSGWQKTEEGMHVCQECLMRERNNTEAKTDNLDVQDEESTCTKTQ